MVILCKCLKHIFLRTQRKKYVTIWNRLKSSDESYLNATSVNYIEQLYETWLTNPAAVHPSWDRVFREDLEEKPSSLPLTPQKPSTSLTSTLRKIDIGRQLATEAIANDKVLDDHMAVQAVIRSYQARGHLVAQLDPLNLMYADLHGKYRDRKGEASKTVVRDHLKGVSDMDRVFKLPEANTFIGGKETTLPLREIIKRLEKIYCHHIGVEYMHLNSKAEIDWIRYRLESKVPTMTLDEKKRLIRRLAKSTGFEAFLAKKWPSERRFGLEGCEVLVPTLLQILDDSTQLGVDTFIFGVAHRGRLNILANVCHKPLYHIFTQFSTLEPSDQGSGDVKYHLGTYVERMNNVTNKKMNIAVVANPSHLESQDAVVQGKTRAEQFYRNDTKGEKIMSISLHGDASFSGQGIVFETMHFTNLPAYTTHGTIHLVINNQIGFTTDPRFSRSSPYCTDVAHVVNVPIFHVNADDVENVIHICKIASEWRATFKKDCVIDLVCYRRNGHNETDEPMFTQPLMYTLIKKKKPVFYMYLEQLVKEKVVNADEMKTFLQDYDNMCEEQFQKAKKETHIKLKDWIDSLWPEFFQGKDPNKSPLTGISEEILLHIGTKFSTPPPAELNFVIHKGIDRILKGRMEMIKSRQVDWALGEALAFGSLLKEGYHVRLSGQDVERGTFSHRHHVLHHQTVDKEQFRPLDHLYPNQAKYSVSNSSLSEYGVLGFEMGFSMSNPNALVIWEAQFGDFSNNAQAIIDLFISSGETKWVRQSGIVLSQPHGLEGLGPEHSSCRVERYLQLCNDDEDVCPPDSPNFAMDQLRECNWIISNCTTPANIFHLLRRQIHLPFRKPVINLAPKSLLRHPEARSSFDDMIEGTTFQRVIPDSGEASKNAENVKKLVFCTGKVYYDIRKKREEKKMTKDIAVTRVEQISPFPYDLIKVECAKYPNAKICWTQEEHKNQGCWHYVYPRFLTALERKRNICYIGRAPSPSPATGSKAQYIRELANLYNDFLSL